MIRFRWIVAVVAAVALTVSCAKSEDIKTPSDDIVSIHTTSDGELWFGTNKGISFFSPEKGYIAFPGSTSNWFVPGIVTDKAKNVWAATSVGVYKLESDQEQFNPIVPNLQASAIAVDKNDNIWAATLDQGLAKIASDTLTESFTVEDGLPSNRVLSVLPSNYIWAGTDQGLARYDGSSWATIPALEDRSIFSLAEYKDLILAGTEDGVYMGKRDELDWSEVVLPASEGKVITAIGFFLDNIIVGTKDGGLLIYKDRALSSEPIKVELDQLGQAMFPVSSIANIGNESVVVGTFGAGAKNYSTEAWAAVLRIK